MLREIIVPENNTYLLKLPDELVGKRVEVIAFEIEEKTDDSLEVNEKLKSIREIFDGKRIDLSSFKFNRDEANDYD